MFVGRDREKALLNSIACEEGSQFVAVYGRRRVGKTMLIRESFGYSFTFQHAGLAKGSLSDQLYAFADSLRDAGLEGFDTPRSWLEAFSLLKKYLANPELMEREKLLAAGEPKALPSETEE